MTSLRRGANEALSYTRGIGGRDCRWRPPTGEDIKSLRERLKMTQTQFAEEFGLDLSTLQNWEQGRRQPEQTAALLLKLIDQEPKTVASLVAKVRHRQLEPV